MKSIVKYQFLMACCLSVMLVAGLNKNVQSHTGLQGAVTVTEEPDTGTGMAPEHRVIASQLTISGEELLLSRSNNLMEALQGRVPGLRVMQTGGEPGMETFSSHIRGNESPSASPLLILVDGVERSISDIDLNDIESVTILRDAAATAQYGLRAAAGAILVSTRRGYEGTSAVNVTYDHSVISTTRLPQFVSAYDYVNMFNQRQANDTLYADMQDIARGGTGIDHRGVPFYTPFEIERYHLGDMQEFYPVRDMLDEFLKDFTSMSRVNMNFRGGSNQMKYFTSVGFQNQDGMFETLPFERYSYDASSRATRFNFRTNLDLSLNKTLHMWVNVAGSMSKINMPYRDLTDVLAKLYETPNAAHNDLTPDGEILIRRDRMSFMTTQSVFGLLNRTGSRNQTHTRLGTNFGLKQELDAILPGLSASGQMAFDVYSRSILNRSRSYQAFEVVRIPLIDNIDSLGYGEVPGTSNTGLSDGQGRYFSYMYDMYLGLNYQRYFRLRHHVHASLRAENNILQQEDLLNRYYMGLAGGVSYTFDNKYLADFSFAYQGSEQFAKGKRFGFFPSLALGWIVSDEDFLLDNKTLIFLKLRTSLGQVGNTGFNYGGPYEYLYLTRWNANATENQIGNENLTWETTTKFNIGFDAGLFNAFYISADYFYHKVTDILVFDIATLPTGFIGIGNAIMPPANVGEIESKGFELLAGYGKSLNKDLYLNVSGNVSLSENEQLYMAELPYDETYAYAYRKQGYPLNYFWGYKTDGLFNSQAEIDGWADQSPLGGHPIPGDIKYLDLNNDGVIDERDRAPLGLNHQPNLVYGFRAEVRFRQFDLGVFVNGTANRNVYLNNYGRWSNRDNFTEYMKNAWTAEKAANGENIVYPRLAASSTNHIQSDYWIVNGSFIRLRNVEIGYTVPPHIARRINAGSIRIYANGLNLFVWDNLPGKDFDPETASSQNTAYPLTRSVIFGASVRF